MKTYENPNPKQGSYFGCSILDTDNKLIVGARCGSPTEPISNGYILYDNQVIEGSQKHHGDRYGVALACTDDWLIVGAYRYSGFSNESGCVYVYKRIGNKIEEYQILVPSDPDEKDYFGYNIDIKDNTIIVGAYEKQDGCVYIYDLINNTWIETAKIIPQDSCGDDRFGRAVCFGNDSNTFYVGAIYHLEKQGAVYKYQRNESWSETNKVLGKNHKENLGNSIQYYDGKLIVGSYNYMNATGAVYVYTDDLELIQAIQPNVPEQSYFGGSVSANKHGLLIGCYRQGAVYYYTYMNNEYKLAETISDNAEWFGYSVYLNQAGDKAYVGCSKYNNATGRFYAYSLLDSLL